MGAFDRSVEFQLALGNVAGAALGIADLWASRMIRSSSEVDIVMAGPARNTSGPSEISSGLQCSSRVRARLLDVSAGRQLLTIGDFRLDADGNDGKWL